MLVYTPNDPGVPAQWALSGPQFGHAQFDPIGLMRGLGRTRTGRGVMGLGLGCGAGCMNPQDMPDLFGEVAMPLDWRHWAFGAGGLVLGALACHLLTGRRRRKR